MKNNKRTITLGLVILFITIVLTLCLGRYQIKLDILVRLLFSFITPHTINEEISISAVVLWSVRLPRILMAILTGAALSVSGAVFQGLFRNPLVSPSILGVSSGASFGAALAILLAGRYALAVEVSAFAWALIAVTVAYNIGHRGSNSVTTLVLSGVIVSAMFNAGLSFLKYKADPYEQLPAIVFWTMGSLNNIVWKDVAQSSIVIIIGMLGMYILRWRLNIMALGDEVAMSLGIDVVKERILYILAATLIVAASISSCGNIGWVGLVVPHMSRLIVGSDHDILIPYSALMGAIFMLLMDTLARTLPGGEMPIGILTSLIGAPFFAYLLIREKRNIWQN